MKRDNRDYVIDCIKSSAIILMVIGHSIQLFNGEVYRGEKEFYDNILYKVIYSFHMPLFMLMSGYLYYFSRKKYISCFKNTIIKLSQYFVPILTFASIKTVWNIISSNKGGSFNIFHLLVEEVYNIFHVLWFLWAIIYSILIIELIYLVRNTMNVNIVITIILCFFFMTPDLLMGNVYKYTILYFGIGYEMNRKQLFKEMKTQKKALFVGGAVWMLLILLYERKHYIYVSGFSLINSEYGMIEQFIIDIFRWGIGLAGALSVWGGFQLFFSYKQRKITDSIGRIMNFIGSNTLIIYSFSTEIFNEIMAELTEECTFSYMRTFVLGVGVIIVCLIISYILGCRYMRPFRKALTGRSG